MAKYSETKAMNILADSVTPQSALNRSLTRAANIYAATSGLELDRALNEKALNPLPNQQWSATYAANQLAGTTDLSLRGALNALVDALP